MRDSLAGFRGTGTAAALAEDDYDRLPRSIQGMYSRQQWLWLSDEGKAGLVQRECEPEAFDE